jgi:transcriptional regulator with XRE-family HTH domain
MAYSFSDPNFKEPKTPQQKIGMQIRLAATKAGLSQKKLGELVHVPQSTISDYVLGEIEPRATMMLALSKALDVSLDYFYEGL